MPEKQQRSSRLARTAPYTYHHYSNGHLSGMFRHIERRNMMTAEHVIITGRAESRQGNAEEHHVVAPQFHQHTGQKAAESDSEVERNKET